MLGKDPVIQHLSPVLPLVYRWALESRAVDGISTLKGFQNHLQMTWRTWVWANFCRFGGPAHSGGLYKFFGSFLVWTWTLAIVWDEGRSSLQSVEPVTLLIRVLQQNILFPSGWQSDISVFMILVKYIFWYPPAPPCAKFCCWGV